MSQRRLGFVQFRQNFLFVDDATYDDFGHELMQRFHSDAKFLEQAYKDRGIEILENNDFEVRYNESELLDEDFDG